MRELSLVVNHHLNSTVVTVAFPSGSYYLIPLHTWIQWHSYFDTNSQIKQILDLCDILFSNCAMPNYLQFLHSCLCHSVNIFTRHLWDPFDAFLCITTLPRWSHSSLCNHLDPWFLCCTRFFSKSLNTSTESGTYSVLYKCLLNRVLESES